MADSSDRYVDVSAEQASRLRAFVVERMEQDAKLTRAEIRRRGGASPPVIKDVLDAVAKQYWPTSLRQVSVGVGWTPMSIEHILKGGEPTMADEDNAPDDLEGRVRQIEAELPRLADELRRQADVLARIELLLQSLRPGD